MDSLSQAALGAAVACTIAGKGNMAKAALAGAAVGTLPDLDVLLLPFVSKLEGVSLHRGYSHSIIISFLAAFPLAYFLSKWKKTSTLGWKSWWWICFIAWFTHIILDVFTSYGTQVFLPFSDYRLSLDSVAIIDPFYTLPLLAGLILSFLYRNKNKHASKFNRAGLAVSSFFLLTTLVLKGYSTEEIKNQLIDSNIQYNKLLTVPVGVGGLQWYAVAKSDSFIHMAKWKMLDSRPLHFEAFPINDQLLGKLDPHLVDRMKWFSQGFYTVAEEDGHLRFYNMQCDMQGIQYLGEYKVPTAFYFEILQRSDGSYALKSGMHKQ